MSHSNKPNLRHYIDIVENAQTQQAQNEGILSNLAQGGKKVAGWMGANPVKSAAAAGATGAALGSGMVGQFADKVGQVASGAWNGATQAYHTPLPDANQAGKAHTPAKPDPAVLKQQQELIAKGAKIKADGIMGPATQAAIKQFGGTPDQPQAQAGQAAPAPAPEAPAAQATPAAPSPYAGSPEQEAIWNKLTPQDQAWLIQGGQRPNLMDPHILDRAPNKGQPAPATATAQAPAAAAQAGKAAPATKPELTPQQQAQNMLQPGYNKESAEPEGPILVNEPTIARIVSLANFGK